MDDNEPCPTWNGFMVGLGAFVLGALGATVALTLWAWRG